MTEQPDGPQREHARTYVLLAALDGAREDLVAAVDGSVPLLADSAGAGAEVEIRVLIGIDDDPFPAANPGTRPMDAIVTLQPAKESSDPSLVNAVSADLVDLVRSMVAADESAVVVGWPQPIVPGSTAELRYLYLMRRKPDLTVDNYINHYFTRHSAFGLHLRGITSYTQIHADLASSAALGRSVGLTSPPYDSISELCFHSIEEFFAGVTPEAAEASNDELLFVDRDRSVSLCTTDRGASR
jgi:hypothetical protein